MEKGEGVPSYDEIRSKIEQQKNRIDRLDKGENELGREYWYFYDAPLISHESKTNHAFNIDFAPVLPREYHGKEMTDIRVYIENLLESRKGRARGVEFGGPADKLFQGFTPGFFAKTAGVVINDLQPPVSRTPSHRVIEGDIFSSKTKAEVLNYFENQPVDLIFERLGGGMRYTPFDSRFTVNLFASWYEMLSPGGVMFVQLPIRFYELLPEAVQFEEWKNYIARDFQGKIEVQDYSGTRAMRLNKFEGAPEKLPFEKPWVSETVISDEFN